MAKSQKRSSREAKKPKAAKPKVLATSNLTSTGALAQPSGKNTKKK